MNSRYIFQQCLQLSLVVVACSQTCLAEQTYLIRFKFQPNETLRYQSSQTVVQTAAAASGQKIDSTKVDQTRVFTVQELDQEGNALVSMQFEHVRMEMKSDSNDSEVFDSKMPDSQVPNKFRHAANKLKGAAPKYTLNCTGTPVSELGFEAVDEAGQASFMMPLPAQEVKVGDTWKTHIRVTTRIAEGVKREIPLLRTYRLESVQGNIATITFATSCGTEIKSPSVKAQLLQATPLGTVTFDLEKGIVLSRQLKFDKSVLGALGPNTLLSAVGTINEELLPEAEPAVTVR